MCDIILKIATRLNKISNDRLFKMREINIDDLRGYQSDWTEVHQLNAYQFSKIPIRDRAFFKRYDKEEIMFIVKEGETTHFFHNYFSDEDILFTMQNYGYRFVMYSERASKEDTMSFYKRLDPTCEACIHKHGCSSRLANDFAEDGGECFEAPASSTMLLPPDLLRLKKCHAQ